MKSQTLGSSLLVAGTSIGAGMLALPLISATTGLWWALLLMLIMWGLATYGGLLIAEACRACPEAENLHGVVGKLMGHTGQLVTVLGMLFLYYSLCSAYISGGASVLQNLLDKWNLMISFKFCALIVTATVAVLVVTGTEVVDVVNRIMFALMLLLLVIILYFLIPETRFEHLAMESGSPAIMLAALPVLYSSFGYHCAVPTVVQYVNGKPYKFRRALIAGSILPFIIYIIWQTTVIGVLSSSTIIAFAGDSNGVNEMMNTLSDASLTPSLGYLITAFAALALTTSFLGVSLGLFDYLTDVYHRPHNLKGTLLLPLLAALYLPGSFIIALGYAAIALVVVAVFIPVATVWKVRKLHMEEPYQVAGGIPALIIAVLAGCLVIAAQLGMVTGQLPSIG